MNAVLTQLRKLPSYQHLAEILGADTRRTAIELIVTSLCLEAVYLTKYETQNKERALSIVKLKDASDR